MAANSNADKPQVRGGQRMTRRLRQAGFSMLEVLVALVVVVIGLLGVIGLQTVAQQSNFESYQRAQALIMLNDMAEKINTNRASAGCFAISGATASSTGTPYFGTSGTGYVNTINCTSGFYNEDSRLLANDAMTSWNSALRGATETRGGSALTALVGARGCVTVDAATNTYTVAVVWQGMTSTVDTSSVIACAKGLYGGDANRRVVSTTLRLATLL